MAHLGLGRILTRLQAYRDAGRSATAVFASSGAQAAARLWLLGHAGSEQAPFPAELILHVTGRFRAAPGARHRSRPARRARSRRFFRGLRQLGLIRQADSSEPDKRPVDSAQLLLGQRSIEPGA